MRNWTIGAFLFVYAVLAVLVIVFFKGTCDLGDGILHYQFARYAPLHPQLYFHHWAKPVFVLLASPFAQFGIVGIKVFNTIVFLVTLLFTFKIAQKLGLKNELVAPLMLLFSPLCFVVTFSGLTEPLFALFVSIGVFAVLHRKFMAASLIISFLPFVRSEGLIILGVFVCYFLVKGKWRLLPLFLFGHVAYSIAGLFVYHDLFWVFNRIPYARLSSTYGSGSLFHFVDQLIYVVGVPIYALLWLGVCVVVCKYVMKRAGMELLIMVLGGFMSFFVAHTLFWYLGIFNSMGLKRVLVSVAPLMSILSLVGYNFIEELLIGKRAIRLTIQVLLISSIMLFPFTSNHAAIHWEKDMRLSAEQQSAIQVGEYINRSFGHRHRFLFEYPYLSETLGIDPFDERSRIALTKHNLSQARTGDIFIWDSWFSVVEQGITKEQLDSNARLTNLLNTSASKDGKGPTFSVYILK